MVWVFVDHIYSDTRKGYFLRFSNPIDYYTKIAPTAAFRFILNGYLSVDSFFFLGGFLLSLITLKEMDKKAGKLDLLQYYLHRYLR